MSFLSSQRASNTPSQDDTRPLPPQPLQPIENVHKARKEKRRRPQPPPPPPVEDDRDDASGSSSGGGGGSIMRRMSSMFRPKRKPLPPPSNLNFSAAQSGSVSSRSHNAIGYMYMAPDLYRSPGGSVESETYDESEDDIRRPSGLGSAVSLTLPPSPSLLIQPDVEKVANPSDVSSDGVYNRSRAISSPNLLRSLSQKAKNKLRRRSVSGRKSVAQNPVVPEMPPPPPPPVLAKPTRSFEFPAEVLDLVFSHLPRKTIVSLCPLSRAFCSSGRVNLYHKLELDTLSPLRLQKLLALLASRNDLTDLVQECVCRTWPSFLSPPSPPRPNRDDADDDEDEPVYGFEDPRREEDELKDRLLAATFTLALQRMSNLVKLTLPNFDRSLLAQHTAFGLRSLTFMCSKMTGEEMSVLFTWLDGQINVVELTFPVLEDTTTTDAQHNPPQDATPIHQHQARNSINLLQVPTANGPINRATTPLSPYFESRPLSPVNPAVRQSLLGSPTLLPSLTTLHATPAILALLQPSSTLLPPAGSSATSSAVSLSNSDTSLSTRRLQNVYLNISTTLYTGLRPNTVMASLRGTVTKLGVRFGESVDKRTVEKVLGAVAAILGSRSAAGASNGNGNGGGTEDRATWRGLEELEVSFKAKSALMPGMEETLYKTLQTTLPRYTHLHKLSLNFPSSSNPPKGSARSSFVLTPPTAPPMELEVALKGDTVFRFPAPPPSPLPSPTAVPGLGAAQQQARYSHLKSSYPIQPISDGTSTAVYPSFDTIRGTSTTKRMSLFNATDMGKEIPRVVEGTWEGGRDIPIEDDNEKLSPKDKARVEIWAKQCPSLRAIVLPGGVVWDVPVVEPAAATTTAESPAAPALHSPPTSSSSSSSAFATAPPSAATSPASTSGSPKPSQSPRITSSPSPSFLSRPASPSTRPPPPPYSRHPGSGNSPVLPSLSTKPRPISTRLSRPLPSPPSSPLPPLPPLPPTLQTLNGALQIQRARSIPGLSMVGSSSSNSTMSGNSMLGTPSNEFGPARFMSLPPSPVIRPGMNNSDSSLRSPVGMSSGGQAGLSPPSPVISVGRR